LIGVVAPVITRDHLGSVYCEAGFSSASNTCVVGCEEDGRDRVYCGRRLENRDTETETQRQRQRHRHRQRQTKRQREEGETERDRETDRDRETETERQNRWRGMACGGRASKVTLTRLFL
jgi:hypothetical protein